MSLPTISYGQQDEMPQLRSQNDQLWKIIEKQRIMIQNLQKDNVRLAAERDGLQDKVNILKRELVRKQKASLLISPQALYEMAEADDNASPSTPTTAATPSSETAASPVEISGDTPTTATTPTSISSAAAAVSSPMPPPRSPYRPLIKEKSDDALFFDSNNNNKKGSGSLSTEQDSTTTTASSGAATDFYSLAKNSLGEEYIDNGNVMNGRSSPGSPAPGPQAPYPPAQQQPYQQLRKDSAPLPSTKMPVVVPSPNKSTSLETRKNARRRDSMIPSTRGLSPTDNNSINLDHSTNINNARLNSDINTTHFDINTTHPNTLNTNPNHLNTTTTANIPTTNTTNTNRQYESIHPTASRTERRHNNGKDDGNQQQPRIVTKKQQQMAILSNLPSVFIKVVGSNIKANEKGKEVISFIISIGSYRENNEQSNKNNQYDESWRVEKLYSDFLALDSKLKAQRNRAVSNKIGKLPDKALFSNNAPTKVDQRKIALEQYLQHVLSLPLDDPTDLRTFLSTDIINTRVYQFTGQKEGYLTKRGKNFGGWKTRYFVLNEAALDYYESKEGTQLGSIRLTNAQIGTQMQGPTSSDDSNSVYRHAFLIVEQKRSGSSHSVRHILCASSDDDRDTWVHALLQNISIAEDDAAPVQTRTSTSSSSSATYNKKKSSSEKPRKLSKGEIRAISATPISHLKLDHVGGNAADMQKLTSVPTINTNSVDKCNNNSNHHDKQYQHYHQQHSNNHPLLGHSNSSDPALNTSANIAMASPLSLKNNMTWSSSYETRSSFDQSHSSNSKSLNNLKAPRPGITRRSSMGNLLSTREYEEHKHRRAVSPTVISRIEDHANPYPSSQSMSKQQLLQMPEPISTATTVSTTEKKARNKAHRMTFWGKKMLFNNSNSDGSLDNQNLQLPTNNLPQPSQSSLTIPNASSSTSNVTPGLRGFLSRSSHEQQQNDRHQRNKNNNEQSSKHAKRVFGVPLEEAVRISRVTEGYDLPAVVYRCIEFLDAMNAVHEEGIYRLSGSNATLKALRERFNQEGDVPLLKYKQEYDIHVVAGLLKMWLRELPTSVLTREHRMDFLHVIDLLDREDRVNELGRLVSLLPLANYTLLRALTAHLIRVVQHSDINKMTMRNVSIVFSPTLGIPPTIFNLFISEFDYIFWTTKNGDAAPRKMMKEEGKEEQAVTEEVDESKSEKGQVGEAVANSTYRVSQEERTDGKTINYDASQVTVEQISNDPPLQSSGPGLGRKTTLRLREEHGRSNRNSVTYMDGAPVAIVDLEKHQDGPLILGEVEDEEMDDLNLNGESSYPLQT
ncbi:hypothetical protein BDF20DRAFT_855141 [Mycotypha africana]|uniref:uncharacterized protein n=1 Tax=Mycotypha africana TaxID=64632 RepID=UPI002300C30C|nr:uncharacterized protein BDF20DRAFT_855141 [Mycotypha africana]KAI8988323.1 hypothetical protein BDF20DRAFT_855141 [Mycotypha africana]